MIHTLAGTWKLIIDPENKGIEASWFKSIHPNAQMAPVPGVIQQVFPGYHGVAWYWHEFKVNRLLLQVPDGRILLRFGAVDYLAKVWVNGTYLGQYEGGETPFEFDVTTAIRPDGDNLLAVRVLNPTNESIDGYLLKEIPHRNKTIPATCGSTFNSGGIMYPVELYCVPPVSIIGLFVRPRPESGRFIVTISVYRSQDTHGMGQISLSVSSSAGGQVLSTLQQEAVFPAGVSEHNLTVKIQQPHLWNLDDPCLYHLTAGVTAGTQPVHQLSVRSGFRDFRVVNGYFYLNGKRIFVKSTHTGNCMPIGQQVAVSPDFVRRDLVYAKASGFNMVRFIAGAAYPDQLNFCDEIGLMVYEECFAGWCLEDSPYMPDRFKRNTLAMVKRDRNHPCVTVWGLLNETRDGAVFHQAVKLLPELRQLDPTRLVLLSSGRWDANPSIGSVSNPGSTTWEPAWGFDGTSVTADKPRLNDLGRDSFGGYVDGAGDAHVYPGTPHTLRTIQGIRSLGQGTQPVFLSEYGIGSLMNVINEWRHFIQIGASPELEDASILHEQSEALTADWERLGFNDVYPFPEDLLSESQRLHARQRTLGFNALRANPQICGYNLTGMLDHAITGEGLWTYWRHWKPATFDSIADGWSSLRWCLFVNPLHGYTGRPFTIEAVLANEDVLPAGEYPATFRITGPGGTVWERSTTVKIPDSRPLAVSALCETVKIDGPAGQYTFAAEMKGAAPSGGRLAFYLSEAVASVQVQNPIAVWGIDQRTEQWLQAHGVSCLPLRFKQQEAARVTLVGFPDDAGDSRRWDRLKQQMAAGATLLFICPRLFIEYPQALEWLPLINKGRCYTYTDWLYHKECVAQRHPVFAGLQAPGIMDWDYYGPVIPHEVFEGQDTPDETIAASFATGSYLYPRGYGCHLLIATYRTGQGRFILNTLSIIENLDDHPAADKLLLNLVSYAAGTS
jgi:hypothetical protein